MPMYNSIEYSSNYSETTGSLSFYSKDAATNFDVDIVHDDEFKSFKYSYLSNIAKLLRNTAAQPALNAANRIPNNAPMAVLLKYLSNFWGSLEIPVINSKVELKIRWIKHCVLSVGDNDNANGNNGDNNIFFTIKDTKLYVPIVTSSARYSQRLSKHISKGFER